MLKIFQIELPESLFLEEAYSYMVYSEGVRVDRKCVAINPASWVKFDTYHNFIPYKKIKEITN